MRKLLTPFWFIALIACQPLTTDQSTLARVTVYWRGEGSGEHAASNGARLSESDCAVDPKKIPYGSQVVFPDTACVAVDTGPDVVNRKAARVSGRNAAERKAIVIDRFFDTKEKALAWAKAHAHFLVVRVRTSGAQAADQNGIENNLKVANSGQLAER
jgi:hypothetical protein